MGFCFFFWYFDSKIIKIVTLNFYIEFPVISFNYIILLFSFIFSFIINFNFSLLFVLSVSLVI